MCGNVCRWVGVGVDVQVYVCMVGCIKMLVCVRERRRKRRVIWMNNTQVEKNSG